MRASARSVGTGPSGDSIRCDSACLERWFVGGYKVIDAIVFAKSFVVEFDKAVAPVDKVYNFLCLRIAVCMS